MTSTADAPEAETQNKQTQRSNLSTRRLLEASASLIAERGYERTTLAEIGKRAGYSYGLVSRRFGNKANLLIALLERMSTRFGTERMIELVGDRVGVDALQHVVHEIRDDLRRSPDDLRGFYALIFEGLKPIPELHEHLVRTNYEFREGLATLVRAGLETGQVRAGTDPDAAAHLVANALRGAAYFWVMDPDRVDILGELDALHGYIGDLFRPDATPTRRT